jgi:hypothetical protein
LKEATEGEDLISIQKYIFDIPFEVKTKFRTQWQNFKSWTVCVNEAIDNIFRNLRRLHFSTDTPGENPCNPM